MFFFTSSQQVGAQIQNPGFDPGVTLQDTLAKSLHYHTQLYPPQNLQNEIQFQVVFPKNKIVKYYDPKRVMPSNMFLMDYRGSSYYVPRQINDQLDHIKNRPSGDSFLPVFAIAALAAKVALQYVDIEKKITIEARDYLVSDSNYAILKALWKKSPQTAEQLFQVPEINASRTFAILKEEINGLCEAKLLKQKFQDQTAPQYFSAQNEDTVKKLLVDALDKPEFPDQDQRKIQKLLTLINTN